MVKELNASIVQAEANLAIDARIITDESGEQFVSIDSTTAVGSNLRYIVANDAGQGHGNIRLTVEPDFRTISLNPGRPASIDEDGSLNLEELIVFNGTASAGVDEKLFLTLSSVDGTEGSFILSVNGELRTLDVGTPFSLSLLSLPSAQILQPENFHGSFELKFDLIGSFNDFSSRSTSEVANINVTPVAEIAENQAQAKLILAESESDLAGTVIPVVSGEPSEAQLTRIKLEGGDPSETHSIEFLGIPNGLSILVNGIEKALLGELLLMKQKLGVN